MPRNEAETRADLIDPALLQMGWGSEEGTRINREYRIAPGRLLGGGRRAKSLKADYLLWHNNRKVAVIEAKAEGLSLTEGLGQAKDYATKLGVRFTFSTNGHGFYQVDMETGLEGEIARFPTPAELWDKTNSIEPEWKRRLLDIPLETMGGSHSGRYYQESAVEAVISAIAEGRKRILVTHATGTGKTFVAFQIAWKLFQAKWNQGGGANVAICGGLREDCFAFDPARHGKNYNQLFCDGHVSAMDPWVLFDPTKTGAMWNTDHQPHPEWWLP